ncbi:MAG: RnfABCDGE type electron transport complex subunit D [Alphaproteobacteria bacterium]
MQTGDARHFQIGALALLLGLGILFFGFQVTLERAALNLAVAVAAQALFALIFRTRFDARSPLITGLSLSLLLRTNDPLIASGAAVAAIASKYLIRVRGKHIFNPAAFGIVAALILTEGTWVSPGQWGTELWLGFLCLCLGGLVLFSAARLDIALAFLGAYGGLLLARALWLGDPLAIPLHQMQSGALLLFAFFMITDPRTTPVTVTGRILFACLTALLAVGMRFLFYIPEAIFYALFLMAPLTPLIDRLLPGDPHNWAIPKSSPGKEVFHAEKTEPSPS